MNSQETTVSDFGGRINKVMLNCSELKRRMVGNMTSIVIELQLWGKLIQLV